MLKRVALFLALSPMLAAVPAAGEVNINVNLGLPAPVPIIVREPPLFLVPPPLGFEVAVGLDYDLFRVGDRYYHNREGVWYAGPRYNGPWTVIVYDRLPPGLRKYKLEKVRSLRDDEYRHYKRDEKGYRGRSFRPDDDHGEHGKGKGHGKGNKKHDRD